MLLFLNQSQISQKVNRNDRSSVVRSKRSENSHAFSRLCLSLLHHSSLMHLHLSRILVYRSQCPCLSHSMEYLSLVIVKMLYYGRFIRMTYFLNEGNFPPQYILSFSKMHLKFWFLRVLMPVIIISTLTAISDQIHLVNSVLSSLYQTSKAVRFFWL